MAVIHCTDRQAQILELASRGQSDKEIAIAIGLSVHTVRTHLQRLYRAEGIANRAEAVAVWLAQQESPDAALEEEEERVSEAAAKSAAERLPIQAVPARLQMDLVNQARLAAGLQPLEWDKGLAATAEQSARQMAANGHLDTIIGSAEGPGGRPLRAENVGYWSGINDPQLHLLFLADPKQRANLLGAHRSIGACWAMTEGVAFLSVLFA